MKITSQRSLLWLGNFTIVGCIFFVLFLMSQNSRRKVDDRQRERTARLEAALGDVRPEVRERVKPGDGQRLPFVLDPNMHWAGYIPPVKPKPVDTEPEKEKAPELGTLIEPVIIAAFDQGVRGPALGIAEGSTHIKIKSRSNRRRDFPMRQHTD